MKKKVLIVLFSVFVAGIYAQDTFSCQEFTTLTA